MPQVDVAVDLRTAGPTADFVSPIKRRRLTLGSFQRVKWAEAFRAQLIVVRNAIGSVACAWLVNACYSTGNVFSGKSSRNQSRRELITANSVWAAISFSTITLLAQVPLLLSLKYLDSPDRRPTFWFCLKKLVRNSAFYFVLTVAIMFCWSCFVGYMTTTNPTLFKYKIDCYVNTLATHGFFTGLTLTTKRIYYRESVQGRDRFVLAQQSGPVPIRTQKLSFWRAFFKEFPKSAPAAVAGIFVHVLSQQRVMDRSNEVITSFLIASFLVKFAIQEVIKHYVFKKRIRSIRVMSAAVALPTVLVDTQTRIILLGTQSTNFLAFGTLGMAFLEICLRGGKAHFVYRKIHKRKAKRLERRSTALVSSHPHVSSRIHSKPRRASSVEFNQWSSRVQAYHVAETISDMYAEYIAIGCSASILVFLGDHPHYSLLRKLGMSENSSEQSSQVEILAFQVAVELIVDFLSIILEKLAGVDFSMNKNVEAFLSVFLAAIAVLNINISVGVYFF